MLPSLSSPSLSLFLSLLLPHPACQLLPVAKPSLTLLAPSTGFPTMEKMVKHNRLHTEKQTTVNTEHGNGHTVYIIKVPLCFGQLYVRAAWERG